MQQQSQPIRVAPSSIVLGAFALVALTGLALLAIEVINILVTVFLAVVLGETVRPLVLALEQRGVPRFIAIFAIYLAIVAVVAGSLALILPPLTAQFTTLVREAPTYIQALRELMPGVNQALTDLGLINQIQAALSQLAGQATPLIGTIAMVPVQIVGIIIAVLSGFVLAAFWIGLTEIVDRDVVSRLPSDQRVSVRTLGSGLSLTLGGWLRGQLVLMLFVGTLSFIGLVVLGVRFPVPLAVWAGVTEIFPIIGPWIGAFPAVLVAVLQSPLHGGLVALLYLAIQQVENNLLVPKVMQHAVGLHPFVVLVALLIGGSLLGIAGIIISVPFAAALQVLVSHTLVSRMLQASQSPAEDSAAGP